MNEIEFVKKLATAVNEYCAARYEDATTGKPVSDNEVVIVMQVVSSLLAKNEVKNV